MENWKTTLTGFITAACLLLAQFGITVPAAVQTIILAVGIFIIGMVSKDAKPTQ